MHLKHVNLMKKTKVAFLATHFFARGTDVALYDYADFNETILGNESIIIHYRLDPKLLVSFAEDNIYAMKEKFMKRFSQFYECNTLEQMDAIITEHKIDILYNMKSGHDDGQISKVCKNAIHAVFADNIQVHGDVYAGISDWVSAQYPDLNLPFVPYMVRLDSTKETLHEELNIPINAIVFGRHGGFDTFGIPFVYDAISQAAQENGNFYFIFLNTKQFCDLPNVIFLPATADLVYKTKFINTCDAMIHLTPFGESFGLACAEFSIQNKPIITWAGPDNKTPFNRAHFGILQEKGIYYRNKQDLLEIFNIIAQNKAAIASHNWDAYSAKFSPEVVMEAL